MHYLVNPIHITIRYELDGGPRLLPDDEGEMLSVFHDARDDLAELAIVFPDSKRALGNAVYNAAQKLHDVGEEYRYELFMSFTEYVAELGARVLLFLPRYALIKNAA